MLEVVVMLTWTGFIVAASWVLWRLAYAQGRADAQMGACCGGHEEAGDPVPSPDQWDSVIDRILSEGDRHPEHGGHGPRRHPHSPSV
jgi:hypothetical protein